MSTHSWHHYERWGELHPFAYRKYQQRRRHDYLLDFGKLCLAIALWFGGVALVPLAVMWVWP